MQGTGNSNNKGRSDCSGLCCSSLTESHESARPASDFSKPARWCRWEPSAQSPTQDKTDLPARVPAFRSSQSGFQPACYQKLATKPQLSRVNRCLIRSPENISVGEKNNSNFGGFTNVFFPFEADSAVRFDFRCGLCCRRFGERSIVPGWRFVRCQRGKCRRIELHFLSGGR